MYRLECCNDKVEGVSRWYIGDIIPTLYDYNLYTLYACYNDEKSEK